MSEVKPAIAPARRKPGRPPGPYSRPGPLARLDGRRKESALLRSVTETLTAHVGGKPSATQTAIIARCAMLSLHIGQLDARLMANSGPISDNDTKQYLAWSSALVRTLAWLGLDAIPEEPQSHAQWLASLPRAARAAAAEEAEDDLP